MRRTTKLNVSSSARCLSHLYKKVWDTDARRLQRIDSWEGNDKLSYILRSVDLVESWGTSCCPYSVPNQNEPSMDANNKREDALSCVGLHFCMCQIWSRENFTVSLVEIKVKASQDFWPNTQVHWALSTNLTKAPTSFQTISHLSLISVEWVLSQAIATSSCHHRWLSLSSQSCNQPTDPVHLEPTTGFRFGPPTASCTAVLRGTGDLPNTSLEQRTNMDLSKTFKGYFEGLLAKSESSDNGKHNLQLQLHFHKDCQTPLQNPSVPQKRLSNCKSAINKIIEPHRIKH